MAKLKIHQGTGKLTGEPLCYSCTHFVQRGADIACGIWGEILPLEKGPVYSCNKYYNANLPSLSAMTEIAWELATNKGGRTIGFKPPRKRDSNAPPAGPSWDIDE